MPARLPRRWALLLLPLASALPLRAQNAPATTPPGAARGSPGEGTFEILWQAPLPPATACPYPWSSGLWAFTDPQDPTDPNDDREYMVVGRSNGLFIVDATPERTPVPEHVHHDKFDPPTPIFVREVPEALPPGPERNAYAALLNSPTQPYCPGHTVPIDTHLATNREAVVHYDERWQRFFCYSINSLRDGIQIVELQRQNVAPYRLALRREHWLCTGLRGHTINVDSQRRLLFVLTAVQLAVYDLEKPWAPQWIDTYGPTLPQNAWQPQTPHDSIVYNGRIYVSCWQTPSVEVLALDALRANPRAWTPIRGLLPPFAIGGSAPYLQTMHSCWVDESTVPPAIWMLQESRQHNLAVANIAGIGYANPGPWMPPGYSYQRPAALNEASDVVSQIPNPNAPGAPPLPSAVHHLRAEGKVGYFAHYMDGIDQIDLRDPTMPLTRSLLASFDTTQLTSVPGYFFEAFLGVWDVAPHQDSGLVYASAGRENAFVFRVTRGHLNRYWDATPFTTGTLQRPGSCPRIVAPYGVPRAGQPFVVRDGNRSTYRNPFCVWSLYYGTTPPQTAVVDPGQSGIQLDVDPVNSAVLTNPMGDDVFTLNLPAAVGQRYYLQLVVSELQKLPDGTYHELGVHAASRGTWFGVQH